MYNILVDLIIRKELLKLIKKCLSKNYSTVRVGKLLSDMFQIRNGLKQGDGLTPVLLSLYWSTTLEGI